MSFCHALAVRLVYFITQSNLNWNMKVCEGFSMRVRGIKGREDTRRRQPKKKKKKCSWQRCRGEDRVNTLRNTNEWSGFFCFYSCGQKENHKTQRALKTVSYFPPTRSNAISHLTLSPTLHLMIPNVANSTSIMHAEPRLSLQWLNLTTSRSFWCDSGKVRGPGGVNYTSL